MRLFIERGAHGNAFRYVFASSPSSNSNIYPSLTPHRLPYRYSDRHDDASASIVDSSGCTPLHFAAADGHTNVVRTLLLHGAHADRPDKHGITPEVVARENGREGTAEVLTEWVEK